RRRPRARRSCRWSRRRRWRAAGSPPRLPPRAGPRPSLRLSSTPRSPCSTFPPTGQPTRSAASPGDRATRGRPDPCAAAALTPPRAWPRRARLEVLLGARRFVGGGHRFGGDTEVAVLVRAAEDDFGLDGEPALALLRQRAVGDDFLALFERRARLDVDRFHRRQRRSWHGGHGRD